MDRRDDRQGCFRRAVPIRTSPPAISAALVLSGLQFIGRHEPPSRTMACFGKSWDRLAELKRKYDPDCFFKNNFWPLDKDGVPVEPLYNEPPSP